MVMYIYLYFLFISKWPNNSRGQRLTDTLGAAVAPLGGAGVSSVAGDLAGTFQLVSLVTREADDCSNRKACFRTHRARSVYHLSWVRALLDCRGQRGNGNRVECCRFENTLSVGWHTCKMS